jgi:hypothetical protein
VFVYGFAAAFGLEFLISAWPSIWCDAAPGERQPER